jgi:acetoacetate decarboxylase
MTVGRAVIIAADHTAPTRRWQPADLLRYYLEDIDLKEVWTGPAALGLFPHALADMARLPVREVFSALHFKADLTLGPGAVAFDYLKK